MKPMSTHTRTYLRAMAADLRDTARNERYTADELLADGQDGSAHARRIAAAELERAATAIDVQTQ